MVCRVSQRVWRGLRRDQGFTTLTPSTPPESPLPLPLRAVPSPSTTHRRAPLSGAPPPPPPLRALWRSSRDSRRKGAGGTSVPLSSCMHFSASIPISISYSRLHTVSLSAPLSVSVALLDILSSLAFLTSSPSLPSSLSLPRLAAIQRRISETSGDLRSAISSASSLRDKLSSYVDKIDKVGAKSKVSK